MIPALGKQKQVDLCVFKATPIYIRNSRPARAYKAVKPHLKKRVEAPERYHPQT